MRRLTITCVLFCSLTCVALASAMVVRPDARSGSADARRASVARATRFLLGDRAIESNSDRSRARVARAFPFKADHTGTARSIALYVDRGSSARKILVGMYNNVSGKPSKLLVSGSLTNPASGQWDSVDIGSAPVAARRMYWLVVVGQGGTAHLRDRVGGAASAKRQRSAGFSRCRERGRPGRGSARVRSRATRRAPSLSLRGRAMRRQRPRPRRSARRCPRRRLPRRRCPRCGIARRRLQRVRRASPE